MDKKALNERIKKIKANMLGYNEAKDLAKKKTYEENVEYFKPVTELVRATEKKHVRAIEAPPIEEVSAIESPPRPVFDFNVDEGIDKSFLIENHDYPLPSELFKELAQSDDREEIFKKILYIEDSLTSDSKKLGGRKARAPDEKREQIDYELDQIRIYKERLKTIKNNIRLVLVQNGSGITLNALKTLTQDFLMNPKDKVIRHIIKHILGALLENNIIDQDYYHKYIAEYFV